ncbi:hypothetical protein K461DRAFT_300087 [Myriangium duriaei CBS 260.36]|uniref:Methyltransferase domain-containing protein n=1 Tax=Myriangium duriaei CBS 260.36 TaxID=1168546 RepID=A0A9P4IU43_9PEZI|nr:hypothetical protein K461DRAFT_300087 [Myriangium duriaei CBS 260.36]
MQQQIFYNDTEIRTVSSRVNHIQSKIIRRAFSSLIPDSPSSLLDVGCGTALSGKILSSIPRYDVPHASFGIGLTSCILAQAPDRDVVGDLLLTNMGQGTSFFPARSTGPSASRPSNGCATLLLLQSLFSQS